MERQLAERLLEKLNQLYAPFGDAVELVEQISDLDEKKRFQGALAEVMGRVQTDLMIPIHNQYPDLDPFQVA